MPTIHCPSCGRALTIPEHQLGVEAACPLCRQTIQTPVNEPTAIRSSNLGDAESREPTWNTQVPRDNTTHAAGFQSACWWLVVAGWVACVHSFACTCFDLDFLGQMTYRGD